MQATRSLEIMIMLPRAIQRRGLTGNRVLTLPVRDFRANQAQDDRRKGGRLLWLSVMGALRRSIATSITIHASTSSLIDRQREFSTGSAAAMVI